MTDIRFNCPTCACKLKIQSDLQGQRVECPSCMTSLVVPTGEEPDIRVRNIELEKKLETQGLEIQRLERELSRLITELYKQRSQPKSRIQPNGKGRQNETLQRRVDSLSEEVVEKNKALRDAMAHIQQFEAKIRELSGIQEEIKLSAMAPEGLVSGSSPKIVKQFEQNSQGVNISELLELPAPHKP